MDHCRNKVPFKNLKKDGHCEEEARYRVDAVFYYLIKVGTGIAFSELCIRPNQRCNQTVEETSIDVESEPVAFFAAGVCQAAELDYVKQDKEDIN